MPDANADLVRDAALLAEVVREAGAMALRMRTPDLKSWTKGASSPVSDADIAVNDLIEKRLKSVTPGYGWLSEESDDDPLRLQKPLTWIVDPIDGTRAYLARQDDWTVSVALAEHGLPVLGAVFAPASGEFFFAARHRGTTLNTVPVVSSGGLTLDFARIAGPKPLVERLGPSESGAAIHPRIGSLALRLCRVADGTLDAAFAGGNSRDWDLAAADLIVHEAGGKMTGLDGHALVYNTPDARHGLLLAAGSERHQRIVEHFRRDPVS